jgi:hypothetical protein
MFSEILPRFDFGQWMLVLSVTLGVLFVLVVSVVAIVAGEARKVRVARLKTDLARDLAGRGMSAEEIERVVVAAARACEADENEDGDRYAREGPATCDVAVEDGGEWQRAIVLDVRGDTCLVHTVGTSVSDNQWVEKRRVRFPSSVAFDEAARDGWPADYNAQEATVEQDGEWYPAYVLMHLDRCYVHYVGNDWSANEWVDVSRVRFAGPAVAPSGWTSGRRAQTASTAKPEPAEAEV